MRLFSFVPLIACVIAAAIATPTMADSNAVAGGALINSESVALAGTYNHFGGLGNFGNGNGSATFTGGFTATHVRFSGVLTQVGGASETEADIQITGGTTQIWDNLAGSFGAFDNAVQLGTAVDPNGTWNAEFFKTTGGFSTHSQASGVTMTFEEVSLDTDSNGVFAMDPFSSGNAVETSVGEFVSSGLYDTYAITLFEPGDLNFNTEADPGGFNGFNVDTEIAIFDGAGVLLAQNDDGGAGLFSALSMSSLAAGNYTIAVGGWDTTFGDGFVVNPGNSTGDYGITVSFVSAVPEPASFGILGLAFCGLVLRRRK